MPCYSLINPFPPHYSARIYRPSFHENKPNTLVFSHTKRAFWACFRENWVYNFGHRTPKCRVHIKWIFRRIFVDFRILSHNLAEWSHSFCLAQDRNKSLQRIFSSIFSKHFLHETVHFLCHFKCISYCATISYLTSPIPLAEQIALWSVF